ncbi:MAG: hypothetical protein HOW73_02945 [Polyangiaceae bacterium]|nr:hypothetical protein [Polyangiaceae bacterium]
MSAHDGDRRDDDADDDAPVSSAVISTGASDRRSSERFGVVWSVDCATEDTFLYAKITNISEMGIFVYTTEPLPIGTRMDLRFSPQGYAPGEFALEGLVQWINPARPGCPNPGMGVRFVQLTLEDRERLVDVIRTIAYLPADVAVN